MDTAHRTSISRRVALAGLGASGLGLALSTTTLGVAAQDATPPTGPILGNQLAPGVVAEVFAGVPSARAPGQTVYVARFTFQPGAEIFPHSHPGTTILAVASGSFGWTRVEGMAHLVRGAASGQPAAAEDIAEPGTEVILEPGDAIYYEDDVVHTARGAGEEPAVVHATQVLTEGAPRIMPVNMAMGGTPEATP